MEEEKKGNHNPYMEVDTTETTPDDGFVHLTDIHTTGASVDDYKRYHKGYTKTVSLTTNDPRITRPFAYGISILFATIGGVLLLISLLSMNWMMIFFGVCFILIGIFSITKSKKDIDKIEKGLLQSGNYNPKLF